MKCVVKFQIVLILLHSQYENSESAELIDIVTEKTNEGLKPSPIILMIPDKESMMISRRQGHDEPIFYNPGITYKEERYIENHLPEGSPKYPPKGLVSDYSPDYPSNHRKPDIEYYHEYDYPFPTVKPIHHLHPGLGFGTKLAGLQLLSILEHVLFGRKSERKPWIIGKK